MVKLPMVVLPPGGKEGTSNLRLSFIPGWSTCADIWQENGHVRLKPIESLRAGTEGKKKERKIRSHDFALVCLKKKTVLIGWSAIRSVLRCLCRKAQMSRGEGGEKEGGGGRGFARPKDTAAAFKFSPFKSKRRGGGKKRKAGMVSTCDENSV